MTAAFEGATRRFAQGDMPDLIHTVSDPDKAVAVRAPLSNVFPGLGYRTLASLARTRRVTVLDLNWENAVELAAGRVDVTYCTYDIRDRAAWPATVPDTGLVAVHLHGDSRHPRFGRGEKPSIDGAALAHLVDLHADGRLLAVGVSLDEDHDVRELLSRLDVGAGVWGFYRDPDTDTALRHRNTLPGPNPEVCADPDVDFDRLMLLIGDEAQGARWEQHRAAHAHLTLPPLETVVIPGPRVLRSVLDSQAVVILGDPQLGKTTLAHLAAHLLVSWSPDGEMHVAAGAQAALAAVSNPDEGRPRDVIVVENPFGEAPDAAPNPLFHHQLAKWPASNSSGRLIVTSRMTDWVAPDDQWPPDVARSTPQPMQWYRREGLARYAMTSFDDPAVERDVGSGLLDTPGRVRDRALGLPVATTDVGADRGPALEVGRYSMLRQDDDLAVLCALTRLQDCGSGPVERDVLERLAGCTADRAGPAQAMLAPYGWEGRRWLRLATAADRVATDRWMADNADNLRPLVADSDADGSLAAGWTGWQMVQMARTGAAFHLDTPEHASLLLDADPSAKTVYRIGECNFDSWTLAEATHTLVRVWRRLPPEPRRHLLNRILDDRVALGVYAVLESCLYVGGGADTEIWDAVRDRLWQLVRKGDQWQIALALDGIAWRLPPVPGEWHAWAAEAAAAVPTGVVSVIAAYHPAAVDALRLQPVFDETALTAWTETDAEFAERLVVWHFVHQSRARAQMSRQHWVDKSYLCRTLYPASNDTDTAAVDRLLGNLVAFRRPGWALHVAGFVMGALERQVGPAACRRVSEAICGAEHADPGIIAAACTYAAVGEEPFVGPLRAYFAAKLNRDALVDAVASGLRLADGTLLRPPESMFALPPGDVYGRMGVRFPRLVALGYDTTDPRVVANAVGSALHSAVRTGLISVAAADSVLRAVRAGNLRVLEDAVASFVDDDRVDLSTLAVRAAEIEDLSSRR